MNNKLTHRFFKGLLVFAVLIIISITGWNAILFSKAYCEEHKTSIGLCQEFQYFSFSQTISFSIASPTLAWNAPPKSTIFQGTKIRKAIHNNELWFSIIDIIGVLEASTSPRKYWSDLKNKLIDEGYFEVSEKKQIHTPL